MFDEGEDLTPYLDSSTFCRPNQIAKQQSIQIDMAPRMLARLDRCAFRAGVSRQALISTWLSDRLDQEDERDSERKAVAV